MVWSCGQLVGHGWIEIVNMSIVLPGPEAENRAKELRHSLQPAWSTYQESIVLVALVPNAERP
jgi:hypothetical protein